MPIPLFYDPCCTISPEPPSLKVLLIPTVCRCFVPGPQVPPDGLLPSQAVQDFRWASDILGMSKNEGPPRFDGTC